MSEGLLRCLVLEDEWPARNYLVELIQGSRLAQVVATTATVEEAREALAPSAALAIDVAFIDVQLSRNEGNRAGLELVRSLAAEHRDVLLVLATAFENHALEAYQLGVSDYLLKPFSEERVAQCLSRLRKRKTPGPSLPPRIVARRKKNLVFLSPQEIWAFEAADRLTFVHTKHGKFDLDLSLTAIEHSLGDRVVRVHRNWLVTGEHIKELERENADTTLFVGEGLGDGAPGLHVPVSRDRSQVVKDLLLERATGIRRS
ncbi:MAG: LytTR family DNA-binding domain-containing protein [Archangium sp.]